jgi:hypothetical protein
MTGAEEISTELLELLRRAESPLAGSSLADVAKLTLGSVIIAGEIRDLRRALETTVRPDRGHSYLVGLADGVTLAKNEARSAMGGPIDWRRVDSSLAAARHEKASR